MSLGGVSSLPSLSHSEEIEMNSEILSMNSWMMELDAIPDEGHNLIQVKSNYFCKNKKDIEIEILKKE